MSAVPAGSQVLDIKFDYKTKIDGTRRARAVVRGDQVFPPPKPGDKFAQCPSWDGIRMFFSRTASGRRHCKKWDVSQAFVQSDKLAIPIYCRPPPGTESDPNVVWKLVRPLYGLGIAPKAWSDTLISFLLLQGWTPIVDGDATLYVKTVDGRDMHLVFWVDDILVSYDDASAGHFQSFKDAFFARFDTRDEGDVDAYLGAEIYYDRSKGTLTISQERLVLELLSDTNMLDCNISRLPMSPGTHLYESDRDPHASRQTIKFYQKCVGSLNYLVTVSRPDLAFVTHELSRHLNAPGPVHIAALHKVLRYLKGTSSLGITYSALDSDAGFIIGYADSDWASNPEHRKSISALVFSLNGGAVVWKCRRQTGVATSSTEAEFISASKASQVAVWLTRLARGLGIPQRHPIPIFEDNRGCRILSETTAHSTRMRHVDVSVHNVQHHVARRHVCLLDCPSADMLADPLTKALPEPAFIRHREVLFGHAPRTSPRLPTYPNAKETISTTARPSMLCKASWTWGGIRPPLYRF